jgi:hypothetical protein
VQLTSGCAKVQTYLYKLSGNNRVRQLDLAAQAQGHQLWRVSSQVKESVSKRNKQKGHAPASKTMVL